MAGKRFAIIQLASAIDAGGVAEFTSALILTVLVAVISLTVILTKSKSQGSPKNMNIYSIINSTRQAICLQYVLMSALNHLLIFMPADNSFSGGTSDSEF
jgi:hypothetical protein